MRTGTPVPAAACQPADVDYRDAPGTVQGYVSRSRKRRYTATDGLDGNSQMVGDVVPGDGQDQLTLVLWRQAIKHLQQIGRDLLDCRGAPLRE